MTNDSEIKLYTLVAQSGQSGPVFSPHVWKAILDLKFLGVPYSSQPCSFPEIRGRLAKDSGNPKVTVPTLLLNDEEHKSESFKIAEYLEETYAQNGKSLFGSPGAKNFARFIDNWCANVFAPDTRPLIVPHVISRLDAPSKEYFINVKLGSQATYDSLLTLNANPTSVQEKIQAAKKNLKLIDSLLGELKQNGQGPFLNGPQPGHADFILFGQYGFARVNPVLIKGLWESEDLPNVVEWVGELKGTGLIEETLLA